MKKIKILSLLSVLALLLTSLSLLLSGCGGKERVVLYCASEEERIAWLQQDLNAKFPDYEIVLQVLGTGEMVTKLQGEGVNSPCDIVFDLESCNATLLAASGLFADLSAYDFSIYTDDLLSYTQGEGGHKYFAPNVKCNAAVIVNKQVLAEKGLPIPQTHAELLDPKYNDLIEMPNPKTSGTGYCYYNGLASKMGNEGALAYFTALNENVKEFTSSGSAPIKAVSRGEIGIGIGLLWQAVAYANADPNLEVIFPDNESPYAVYTFGMIRGKEQRPAVKEVFDYLYTDANHRLVAATCPGVIYKTPVATTIENWPTTYQEIPMQGLYDNAFKQELLDKWPF